MRPNYWFQWDVLAFGETAPEPGRYTYWRVMRYLLFSAAMLVGCAQGPQKGPNVVNYETRGNLQTSSAIACVELSSVSNRHTPADIYPGVAQCINSGAYDRAIRLYALAGVYGRFDMLRVSDSTARQAIQVLQMNNSSSIPKEKNDAFIGVAGKYLEPTSKELKDLCAQIKSIGAPDYQPAYMIQHGMGAVIGNSGSGVKKDFDPVQGWEESLSGYLHCP